jgi:hypothetical protein
VRQFATVFAHSRILVKPIFEGRTRTSLRTPRSPSKTHRTHVRPAVELNEVLTHRRGVPDSDIGRCSGDRGLIGRRCAKLARRHRRRARLQRPNSQPGLSAIHAIAHFIGQRSPEQLMCCGEVRNVPVCKRRRNRCCSHRIAEGAYSRIEPTLRRRHRCSHRRSPPPNRHDHTSIKRLPSSPWVALPFICPEFQSARNLLRQTVRLIQQCLSLRNE